MSLVRIISGRRGRTADGNAKSNASFSLTCSSTVLKCRTQARTERARAVRHETQQHLRSNLCQNKCMVRTAPFSPAILVTGWWLVLCALFFCVFLYFEGSFAYLSVFPSVFAPLFLFFTVFVRCCGRASPLELHLLVFRAYSRMSLREQ